MKVRTTVNFEFLNERFPLNRGIGLQGGTRSAKSSSSLQYIVKYCFENYNKGKEIIIGRDSLSNLKKTTLNDFEAVCHGFKGIDPVYPQLRIFDKHQNPRCEIEGNLINFAGLNDDPMRTHGMDSDLFYLNEAVSVYPYCFKQLNQRCRDGWILDWNPSEPNSWVYDLELRDDVEFLRTTFEDNPFLNDEIVREILGYEPTEENIRRGTADARMWSIYGRGEVHKGREIIFPDWVTYQDEPTGYDHCFYGLDWGWNDELAVVKIIIDGNNVYLREIVYGSEIEFDVLVEKLMQEPLLREQKTYIVCDSSEPRSIKNLQKNRLPAMAVRKTPGSILDGIRRLNAFSIHIHAESGNVQREFNNYKYRVDQKTETVTDIPVDKFNHSIDAIRYPILTFNL